MTNWFHKLFNPHCPSCIEQKHEDSICQSCETLKMMLEQSNYEKKQLLDKLLNPVLPVNPTLVEYEPIQPKNIPWTVRRQMLEAEDRKKAELLRNAPKPSVEKSASLEVLEKELGISENIK